MFKKRGKPVFVPTETCRRVGNDIKRRIERAVNFDPFYFHQRRGGHISALHEHRPNQYFARIDIERFFYSIGRNRLKRALKAIGIERADNYAKWSTVKNPFGEPPYALPYGFVQSPILATLVLGQSQLGAFLRAISTEITVSVYVDDISLSSQNEKALQTAFDKANEILVASGFTANVDKTVRPSPNAEMFNCSISEGVTVVTSERIAEFQDSKKSRESNDAFTAYCQRVAAGNS